MNTGFSQRVLVLGAAGNYCISLFHLVIVFVGAPGYRYFGVSRLAELQEKGSWTPALLTLALAAAFALFGTYALSGAGVLRRLPLLRTVLLFVGALYVLRGLPVVPQVVRLVSGDARYGMAVFFSGVSLLIGLAYVVGTVPLFGRRARPALA